MIKLEDTLMKFKTMDDIRYGVMSDLHLGRNKPDTLTLINNLDDFFRDNIKVLSKLHILFIAGDIYDKLLSGNSEDYKLILQWLMRLMLYCKKYNIKLRVLHGTPSHDWNQADILNKINNTVEIYKDFKYINNLHIEIMHELGLSILYIPDEWNHSSEETFQEVKELMKEHYLTKVDVVIMHGQFHHQLPGIELTNSHNIEDYLSITDGFISPGHIHIPSVMDRVIAQGSMDRLSHGEEEDKGMCVFKLSSKGNEYKFIKNKNAVIFKTINIKTLDIDICLNQLDKVLSKVRDMSYIRLKFKKNNSIKKSMDIIKKRYPTMIFSTVDFKEEVLDVNKNLTKHKEVNSITITKDNIEKLLVTEMDKYELDSNDTSIFKKELSTLI
jgi:hypothetical protein